MSDSDASSGVKVKDEPDARAHRREANGKRASRPPPSRKTPRGGEHEEDNKNGVKAGNMSNGDRGDADSDPDEPEGQKSRKRLKRMNGQARPSEAAEAEDDKDRPTATVTKIFVRDPKDGYLPGSIVRICCQNFLTYDFVQFSPGPRMNMILGPNGTGKSTIACAICIGLGFPTSVLGRASELTAFVKHGYEQGYVEIELKGPIGKPNIVVRRNITTKSNASTWMLNGKSSQKNQVDTEVAKLGVQVGNLCSFLPQDRVNEFAKLKPDELLVETQKVAGHEKLKTWHDKLIEMGAGLKEINEALATERQDCSNEEGKNMVLEREVAAFNKRKQLEEDVALYSFLAPYYTIKRDKLDYTQLRLRWKEAGIRYRDAVAEHKPVIDFRDEFKKELEAAEKKAKDAQAAMTKAQRDIEQLKQRDKQNAKKCLDIQEDISALNKSEEDSKAKIRELKANIARNKSLIEKLQNEAQVDPAPWIAKKEDLNRRLGKLRRDTEEVEESISQLTRDIHSAEEDGERAEAELKRLTDRKQQRYNNMTRPTDPRLRAIADEGFMKAFRWLMDNREHFKKVVEPACFSVQVTDPRFSHAIESCISVAHMKTFIFEHKEDYDNFNKYADTRPFGDFRPTSWFRPVGQVEPPEQSLEDLRAAGFDGFAIDFVEAPELVKWFLKRQLDMHRVGVAINQNAVNPERAAQLFSPRNPGATNRYIVGHSVFAPNRSAYGRRLVQNSTSNISPAVWFTEQPIDNDKKRECQRTFALAKEAYDEKTIQKRDLEAQTQQLNDQRREIREEEEGVNRKIAEIKTRKGKLLKAQQTLATDEETLIAEENRQPVEQKTKTLRSNLVRAVKVRLENVPRLKAAIQEADKHIEAFTLATYGVQQAAADVEKMERVVREYTAKHEELMKRRDDLGELVNKMKIDIAERQQTVLVMKEALAQDVDAKVQTFMEERQEDMDRGEFTQLIDTLEQQKADAQSKLDATSRVNQSVIQTYEQRQAKIETLKESITRKERLKQDADTKIAKIKDQWLPQLNALIARVNERFSAAFDRIQCAGEVRLAEHEDYAKWSIEILVKFRSNEPLQLLTGQRQSGGERSLTTILYLMSLTGLAKTPFALVDEINQGMDQTYERRVHNELIQVTCAEDSGQYFLITPKLLPNLTYHENVTTLIINNGDWLPETRDENGRANNYGDLGANLAAYRRAMREA